jgi:hypothetical protein
MNAVSSARLYWESKLAFFAPRNVPIPAAVSAFPEELYQAPRSPFTPWGEEILHRSEMKWPMTSTTIGDVFLAGRR